MMGIKINNCCAYIGTYTDGSSKGIYICRFDTATGRLKLTGTASGPENPSYLCISKDCRYLYSVIETNEYCGENGGAVTAYSICRETGGLSLLNIRPTRGRYPCHLSTDNNNRYLFAANYGEGTVTVFSLEDNGEIGDIASIIAHKGSGPDKLRQEGPHMHCVVLTPDGNSLCAVDLGTDIIGLYDFTPEHGFGVNSRKPPVKTRPGSGPRHMVFSLCGSFAYLVTELSSEVMAFRYNPAGCRFGLIDTVSVLPAGFASPGHCAAIHISPCGRYLYASSRCHNSIAVFRINQDTGGLEHISHIPVYGKTPRDFAIDPSGRFLLIAGQDSDSLEVYTMELESGISAKPVDTLEIPSPVCIKFACL